LKNYRRRSAKNFFPTIATTSELKSQKGKSKNKGEMMTGKSMWKEISLSYVETEEDRVGERGFPLREYKEVGVGKISFIWKSERGTRERKETWKVEEWTHGASRINHDHWERLVGGRIHRINIGGRSEGRRKSGKKNKRTRRREGKK